MVPRLRVRFALAAAILVASVLEVRAQEYVLLGWNDLGMHCSNKYFSKVVVLPPFNNVSAQLVRRDPDGTTHLVTDGVTISYNIPNNTVSVGKTDFWTYAQQLFGLASPLPPNIGLTGKGLTGVLDTTGNSFAAHGIPVTPFPDSDLVRENPYQLIHLVATRDADGTVLATTDAVIPVSNEVGCVQSGCHSSETSILNNHDDVSGFNRSGPVLCASCHSSNALGTTGIPAAKSFSYRMHEHHADVAGPANAISTCYKCHPGPNTQCLRDIMGKNPTQPMVCQNCHGTMKDVAESISNGRRPWLDEPRCGSCHGSVYAEEPGKLFRQSKGHGGLACSACHGSPHAIQPTVQPNDNVQNVRLQGFAGTLSTCSVCHATPPNGPGPHGIVDTTAVAVADAPVLSSPANGALGLVTNPVLRWSAAARATRYEIQLAGDVLFSALTADDSTLGVPWFFSPSLDSARQYYWRVRGFNAAGAGAWSETRTFTTSSGTILSFGVGRYWNIVSLPIAGDGAAIPGLFPTAMTSAYSFSSAAGYAQTDTLVPGRGYWLRFPAAAPVSLTGTPAVSLTVPVEPGWNLIGSIAESLSAAAVQSSPAGIIASPLFGYDAGYSIAGAIAPGHGYWVQVDAPGEIVLSPGARAKSATLPLAGVLARADRIILQDAFGRTQTLYLTDGSGAGLPRSWYAQPPLPPTGSFDARFTSGQFLERYGDARPDAPLEVLLTWCIAPLSVTWHLSAGSPLRRIASSASSAAVSGDGTATFTGDVASLRLEAAFAAELPRDYALEQNYPNPFNPATTIRYALPSRSMVNLAVYNVSGERIATLVERVEEEGYHEAHWVPSGASGIYFCRLEAASAGDPSSAFVATRKMLLLK